MVILANGGNTEGARRGNVKRNCLATPKKRTAKKHFLEVFSVLVIQIPACRLHPASSCDLPFLLDDPVDGPLVKKITLKHSGWLSCLSLGKYRSNCASKQPGVCRMKSAQILHRKP
jgi:hypothetical protein